MCDVDDVNRSDACSCLAAEMYQFVWCMVRTHVSLQRCMMCDVHNCNACFATETNRKCGASMHVLPQRQTENMPSLTSRNQQGIPYM